MLDTATQAAMCEDTLKWYHIAGMIIFIAIGFVAWGLLVAQNAFRQGANWALGEVREILGKSASKSEVSEINKVLDLDAERKKRANEACNRVVK